MSNQNASMLYDANKKSAGVAYLLLALSRHNRSPSLLSRKSGTAIAMTLLCVIGIFTVAFGIGIVLLIVAGLWSLVDAFLIPGIVRDFNTSLALKFAS